MTYGHHICVAKLTVVPCFLKITFNNLNGIDNQVQHFE